MHNIKQNFAQKVDEVNSFYKLIYNIEKLEGKFIFPNDTNRIERIDVITNSILKSTCYLVLYNLVESTITDCLTKIHNEFSEANLLFEDLSDEIKIIWIRYHYDYFHKASQDDKFLHNLKLLIESWVLNHTPIKLTYEDYVKYNTGGNFAGNLDSKEIRKLCDLYGIDFDISCKQIRTIRDNRNKLAHGEDSFSERGRIPYEYVENLKSETISYLENFISAIEDYITHTKFKKQNS